MTIYFDKRAEVEQAEEAAAVEEKQQKELAKQEASKAVAYLL